jgi:hypothetical protein
VDEEADMRAKLVAGALTTVLAGSVMVGFGQASRGSPSDRGPSRYRIGLWGDVPYDAVQEGRIGVLTEDMNEARLAFSVFDGDIKSGSSRCDDAVYTAAVDRFDAFDAPLVYVPGDNEWTDCHRLSAGGYDNLERLQHLRAVMFARPRSFGRRTMALERQSAAYPENTRWTLGKIVYVAINVPGSNNNKVDTLEECMHDSSRTPAHCAADNAEYAARDAAVRQWVQDSFELARARRAAGIMIVMQANPGFDLPGGRVDERLDPEVDGYTALLDTLVTETKAFGGQVALVHGDTHYFRVDKPLVAPTNLLPNLTRVETFGSPNVAWVKATIDPESRTVFTFEPMLLPGS